MTRFPAAAVFLLGSTLSAWLRFDRGPLVIGWIAMLVCLAATIAMWLREAKRVPQLSLPSDVEQLGARDQLTPEEEKRFADALQTHHREMQRKVWLTIQRQGPGALIGPRAALYYFWLCVLVIALLPATAVPDSLLPQLPRFLLVLLSLAVASLAVAAPLALRDWRNVARSLGSCDVDDRRDST